MSPAPDNVHVVAELISHEELRDLYDQAACVVVPLHNSDYAAGLTTALEALSMNVPLVMTETRGMRNSLDAGNIWWVSAADAGALAATLESLSEDVLPATRPWIQKNCAPPVWTNKIVEVIHR